ncbi:MAG: hypothetical protein MUE46_06340 [Xanthomonadales bacterium]|jgi:hypothetical protein|nr:hypothetical protein [Xanthomonadales bacterium]
MAERRLPMASTADLQRADEAVQRLRRQHADESADALTRRLLWHACLRAAAIGGVTGAAGLLPIPKLAESALGLFGQAAVTAEVQRDLVLRLYALHELSFEAEDDAWLASQLGQSLGGAEVAEQLGRSILNHLIERYARRLLARGLPAAQIVLSGAVPVGTTWLLARRTLQRLAARKPEAEIVTVDAVEIFDQPLALPPPEHLDVESTTPTGREHR